MNLIYFFLTGTGTGTGRKILKQAKQTEQNENKLYK